MTHTPESIIELAELQLKTGVWDADDLKLFLAGLHKMAYKYQEGLEREKEKARFMSVSEWEEEQKRNEGT